MAKCNIQTSSVAKMVCSKAFVLLCSAVLIQKASCMYEPSRAVGQRLAREFHAGNNLAAIYPMEYGLGHYYQGDILLSRRRAGLIYNEMRWSKGVVPYKVAGNFSAIEWAMVERAMDQYTVMTCIRFVKQTNEPYFVTFWNNATGCYSYVGFQADNTYHQINLQTPGCTTYVGTPVHEMMHALGAFHEFTRTDRDKYITINRKALIPEYQPDEFFNANFGITPAQYVSTYNVSYNYGSVMHYSRFAGSANRFIPVMTAKKMWFADFGNNNGLTDTDIKLLNAMYCNNPSVMQ